MIRVLDVETTGLESTSAIVEIGWCDVTEKDGMWTAGAPLSGLVNPEAPIPPVASAVHHIVDADVKDAPALADFIADSDLFPHAIKVFAAHRAEFEATFLKSAPWICTWKVAVTLAPNAPGHKLQELRYWLGLEVDRAEADKPHRAGPDAYVCAALLARMLNSRKMTVEEMVTLSAGPVVLPFLTFGKHAMKPIQEIPTDYLDWMAKQRDMDVNALHTARHHLKLRMEEGDAP
jgi:exodeoxyribonuclease X